MSRPLSLLALIIYGRHWVGLGLGGLAGLALLDCGFRVLGRLAGLRAKFLNDSEVLIVLRLHPHSPLLALDAVQFQLVLEQSVGVDLGRRIMVGVLAAGECFLGASVFHVNCKSFR